MGFSCLNWKKIVNEFKQKNTTWMERLAYRSYLIDLLRIIRASTNKWFFFVFIFLQNVRKKSKNLDIS